MQEESPFSGISACAWFCAVAVVTVGYGDLIPVTNLGRCITVLAMLIGIIVIALPITVVGSTFRTSYEEMKDESENKMHDRGEEVDLLMASVNAGESGYHAQQHCLGVMRPARLRDQIVVDSSAATTCTARALLPHCDSALEVLESDPAHPGYAQAGCTSKSSYLEASQGVNLSLGCTFPAGRLATLQVRSVRRCSIP